MHCISRLLSATSHSGTGCSEPSGKSHGCLLRVGNPSTTIDAVTRDRKSCFQNVTLTTTTICRPLAFDIRTQAYLRNPHRQVKRAFLRTTLRAAAPPRQVLPTTINISDLVYRTPATVQIELHSQAHCHQGSLQSPLCTQARPKLQFLHPEVQIQYLRTKPPNMARLALAPSQAPQMTPLPTRASSVEMSPLGVTMATASIKTLVD